MFDGMQLTVDDLTRLGISSETLGVKIVPAFKVISGRKVCTRCGESATSLLPDGSFYCTSCVGLGRLIEGDFLYRLPYAAPTPSASAWKGQLTNKQAIAAEEVLASVHAGRNHLLWAVTGAGKTEMLFPVIDDFLQHGLRVALASPRIDVIRELAPRLSAAFPNTAIRVQYGGSDWAQEEGALVLATTHQLLRYYRAFDLLIIDEVDAFPFEQTPMLAYAAEQAAKRSIVYLTATPSLRLQQAARRGVIGLSTLNRRFHGAPLPVPEILLNGFKAFPRTLPAPLLKWLKTRMVQDYRVMCFVPNIDWLPPLAEYLRAQLRVKLATVHASDVNREATVLAFRQGEIQLLLTTSILERGVTIPRCAVIVLRADHPNFTASGLIQIAGRAGRAKDSTDDPVLFGTRHYTASIARALREIRQMNR